MYLGMCTYSHVNPSFAGFVVPGAQHMPFKEKSPEKQDRRKGKPGPHSNGARLFSLSEPLFLNSAFLPVKFLHGSEWKG